MLWKKTVGAFLVAAAPALAPGPIFADPGDTGALEAPAAQATQAAPVPQPAVPDAYVARLHGFPQFGGYRIGVGTVGLHSLMRYDSMYRTAEVAGIRATPPDFPVHQVDPLAGDPWYVARLYAYPSPGFRIGVGTVGLRALVRHDSMSGVRHGSRSGDALPPSAPGAAEELDLTDLPATLSATG